MFQGLYESCYTWMGHHRVKGYVGYPDHPFGPEHGKLKYAEVPLYKVPYGVADSYWNYDKLLPTDLTDQIRAGAMSEINIAICFQGEGLHYRYNPNFYGSILNYESHSKGNNGGSIGLFGDLHVEWIRGSQVGLY